MNLMTKANLLFRIVKAPDRALKLNAKLGTKEYPLEGRQEPGRRGAVDPVEPDRREAVGAASTAAWSWSRD